MNLNDPASLMLPTEVTLSAWIKPSGSIGQYATIVGRWGATTSYMLSKYDTTLHMTVNNNAQTVTTAFAPLADGNWHHVTGMADARSGLLRVFIDGIQQNSNPYSGTMTTAASTVAIGTNPGYTLYVWKGLLDDCLLYTSPSPRDS